MERRLRPSNNRRISRLRQVRERRPTTSDNLEYFNSRREDAIMMTSHIEVMLRLPPLLPQQLRYFSAIVAPKSEPVSCHHTIDGREYLCVCVCVSVCFYVCEIRKKKSTAHTHTHTQHTVTVTSTDSAGRGRRAEVDGRGEMPLTWIAEDAEVGRRVPAAATAIAGN